MPLRLALVFHFNQHTNAFAGTANQACYRGLLNVLRAHPGLKFNLHLSGTLLRTLPWFDAQTIAMVSDGLADRQFELLGSTYAQNVPYASDDWDNAQQTTLHRQVLQRMFGVEPSAYWISERCWRQTLLPVIVDGGYSVTLIEDHILHAAGLVDPAPAVTRLGEQSLTVVYDDTILRSRFNFAAWFGRRAQLFKYLHQIAERPGSDSFLLAYAEDAEAMGLWNWEKGYLPHAAWAGLDTLLSELEATGAYELCHLSSARPAQTLGPLPDGASEWMNRSLTTPGAPYHEDGYLDWFDFLNRSPKVNYFRRLYSVLRARLMSVAGQSGDAGLAQPANTPAGRFYHQAIETFCHHQYEFGCIGVGGRGYWGWENARSAFMFARAAELAADPRPRQWVEDVTGDGSDEQIICNGAQLAVITAYGGRLIFWFDLHGGAQWVGNHLAVPAARYETGTTKAPPTAAQAARWLPDTYDASLKPWQSQKQKEAAPTGLGGHLPPWILEREPAELAVYRNPPPPSNAPRLLNAQTGVFGEVVSVDGQPGGKPDELHDYRFQDGGLTYLLFPAPNVYIEKHISQGDAELTVHYRIENRDGMLHRVCLVSHSELCPDYLAALGQGREAFSYLLREERFPSVRNNLTGTLLSLESSRDWQSAECSVYLLAYEVALTFELEVEPRSLAEFEIKLRRCV